MIAERRASGLMIHISSLPSRFGIGDIGPTSYNFVDLLADLGQKYWSILPIHPTSLEYGNSPYQSQSAFAGNTLFISPELLVKEGLLKKEHGLENFAFKQNSVEFRSVTELKKKILKEASKEFFDSKSKSLFSQGDFESFCFENASWIDDYAIYRTLREKSGKPWYEWPTDLRKRKNPILQSKKDNFIDYIRREKFSQYVYFAQWSLLRRHCKEKHVRIVGDVAFYLAYDSADVWTHPEVFELSKTCKPKFVAGVPPDYFSQTGQKWGNPTYDWRKLKNEKYKWWIDRLANDLELQDFLRLDHFRGFVAYWRIPAQAKTAKTGSWIRAPTKTFFKAVQSNFPDLPFVVEDLGYITEPVEKAQRKLGVPGMRVLVFAFDGSKGNPHLPENYSENTVAYTGTHDTNTVKGWFLEEASAKLKKRVFEYLGQDVSSQEISRKFIELSSSSKSKICIIPIQDALSLDSKARMNMPSRKGGNWIWRITNKQLGSKELYQLKEITANYNRS
jgi:4-alpha-glucanotransferase